MAGGLSAERLDKVAAALPARHAYGVTPRVLLQRVGEGALVTVRHALIELVKTNRATFTGPDGDRRYTRA